MLVEEGTQIQFHHNSLAAVAWNRLREMLFRTEELRRHTISLLCLEHVLPCPKAKISGLKPLARGLVECEQLRKSIKIRYVVYEAAP